jgi:hypothetical protein
VEFFVHTAAGLAELLAGFDLLRKRVLLAH